MNSSYVSTYIIQYAFFILISSAHNNDRMLIFLHTFFHLKRVCFCFNTKLNSAILSRISKGIELKFVSKILRLWEIFYCVDSSFVKLLTEIELLLSREIKKPDELQEDSAALFENQLYLSCRRYTGS